jgi:hypothetical protein
MVLREDELKKATQLVYLKMPARTVVAPEVLNPKATAASLKLWAEEMVGRWTGTGWGRPWCLSIVQAHNIAYEFFSPAVVL